MTGETLNHPSDWASIGQPVNDRIDKAASFNKQAISQLEFAATALSTAKAKKNAPDKTRALSNAKEGVRECIYTLYRLEGQIDNIMELS